MRNGKVITVAAGYVAKWISRETGEGEPEKKKDRTDFQKQILSELLLRNFYALVDYSCECHEEAGVLDPETFRELQNIVGSFYQKSGDTDNNSLIDGLKNEGKFERYRGYFIRQWAIPFDKYQEYLIGRKCSRIPRNKDQMLRSSRLFTVKALMGLGNERIRWGKANRNLECRRGDMPQLDKEGIKRADQTLGYLRKLIKRDCAFFYERSCSCIPPDVRSDSHRHRDEAIVRRELLRLLPLYVVKLNCAFLNGEVYDGRDPWPLGGFWADESALRGLGDVLIGEFKSNSYGVSINGFAEVYDECVNELIDSLRCANNPAEGEPKLFLNTWREWRACTFKELYTSCTTYNERGDMELLKLHDHDSSIFHRWLKAKASLYYNILVCGLYGPEFCESLLCESFT